MIKIQRFPFFVIPLAVLSTAGFCDAGFSVDDQSIEITADVQSEGSSINEQGQKNPCSNDRVKENKDKIKSFSIDSIRCEFTDVRSPPNGINTATELTATTLQVGNSVQIPFPNNVAVNATTFDCQVTPAQLTGLANEIKSACENDSNVTWNLVGSSLPADSDNDWSARVTLTGSFEIEL